MLSLPWSLLKPKYDYLIVGSGYGGAITAARIASAGLPGNPSVCILERGREWEVGSFPDTFEKYAANVRGSLNPLGLYELLNYDDISVIKGSGLGGTSLINANVAIVPDREAFQLPGWPASLTLDELAPYFDKARAGLAVSPHPRALDLKKVQALGRRAAELNLPVQALPLAVNFAINGLNAHGVPQRPCIDCGDCVSGCNVSAKNTVAMNYLPMAKNAGAEIFTQAKVEWIEKTAAGWKLHGRWYKNQKSNGKKFEIEAANLILSAGVINTTEILLRSAGIHGLSLSPAIGTRFGGNGDFFGISYNGNFSTQVLGFGNHPDSPGAQHPPGPTIVGAVRYQPDRGVLERFTIEDLSFPTPFVRAAQLAFIGLIGEETDASNPEPRAERILRDLGQLEPYHPDGALNHSMLYLCMGFDDARGTFVFERPLFERDGRVRISWDKAGRQSVFNRINDELRLHARREGGRFVENPLWSIANVRRLITAHPLGGCPLSDDYITGAVDPYGRVYAGDGSVHQGLYVADGSLIPTALAVNPFLTISAVSERIADYIVRVRRGEFQYPQPKKSAGFAGLNPLDVLHRPEAELERIFQNARSLDLDVMINSGAHSIDRDQRTIRNDVYWKGFFPAGHLLNTLSAAVFTGFRKKFSKKGSRLIGLTSDTDLRINANNSLELLDLKKQTGDLPPGRYILLRYTDPEWRLFYDVFKVINNDLLIGRVYFGEFPNGVRQFTFPMSRVYGYDNLTVDDHRRLWESGSVPTKQDLDGVWRMDVLSNANTAAGLAHLKFDLQPDGRLESRFQLMGLIEGLILPSFASNHFQLHDFTGFHDEIRKLADDLLVGKWIVELPAETASLPQLGSLGIFHTERIPGENRPRFGFLYLLHRTGRKAFPTNTLLRPFLDVTLPSGVGLAFDEEMTGTYTAAGQAPVPCRFRLTMQIADLNTFIDSPEHEARPEGTISFDQFDGRGPVTFPVDSSRSWFNYLRVNPQTREAEMRYHLVFLSDTGREFLFEGRKNMQKDKPGGLRGLQEVLDDYVNLTATVYEQSLTPAPAQREVGTARMKFRTFEDLAALGNLASFLTSFRVTGTAHPGFMLQAQMRFFAFTAQFVQREYDPLSPTTGTLRDDVRQEVARGAETPDYFSTRTTEELHSILRQTGTLSLDRLRNTGGVRFDLEKQRIHRDVFWKGSFAKDTLVGWEERVRNQLQGGDAVQLGSIFASGSFWKRFEAPANSVARGHVVNYDLDSIPGDPEVREVVYPNDSRKYFRQGDKALLLTYRNDPYRLVYDTIKVIDDNNAIGVMHLGTYPDGIVFATFVMARHNYPLEKMSIADYRLLAADARLTAPAAGALAGNWRGNLLLHRDPNLSLLRQATPVTMSCTFEGKKARIRYGLAGAGGTAVEVPEVTQAVEPGALRLIGGNTLIGKWDLPKLAPGHLAGLEDCIEPSSGAFAVYFLLRKQ